MDISSESSESKSRVLIIGGGRWSNVYINEILSIPYAVHLDILSRTQTTLLKPKYGTKLKNYYRSFDDISLDKKYDLAIIANQPSRRLLDISGACKYANNLLIEKPICETLIQYQEIDQFYASQSPHLSNWFMSCPFIYSDMVARFFEDNEYPADIYCKWNEEIINDPSYRLDNNVASTAISHFLPVLASYLGIRYSALILRQKSTHQIQLSSKNSSNLNINIAWSRRNQQTEKKIMIVKETLTYEIDLLNKKLKQIGIYKLCGKSLTPIQCQIHELLESKDSNMSQSMRYENQKFAANIFLTNLT